MWKKFLVVCICLVGTFSIVYANESGWFNSNELRANGSSAYQAGGEVSGRVMQTPTNLTSASDLSFKTNDIIEMNTLNVHTNKPLAFRLLDQQTYTDHYSNSCIPTLDAACSSDAITAWFAISNDPIDYLNPGLATTDFKSNGQSGYAAKYTSTKIYESMSQFNAKVKGNAIDNKYIAPRNLAEIHNLYATSTGNTPFILENAMSSEDEMKDNLFTPHTKDPALIINDNGRYWTNTNYQTTGSGAKYSAYTINTNTGKVEFITNSALASSNIENDLRAAAYIDQTTLNNIVFAVSSGSKSGLASIIEDSSKLLKPRYYDNSMLISLESLNVRKEESVSSKFSKDSTIYLKGTANNINSSTVSILIFDKTGNFAYYQPLEQAKGSGYYAFDLTSIPLGTYQIAIVNEVYDETVHGEAKSSLLSDVKKIEIVEPLSDLSYTSTLGNDSSNLENIYQATADGKYATSSSSTIGTVTSKNGVGNATVNGVFENGIAYHVIETSNASHSGDSDRFEVAIDTNTGKPILDAKGLPYIKPILENDKTYLSPGVYQFRIQAYDQNEQPYAMDDTDSSITYPVDKDGNAITSNISVDYGLISDDITTVVYPSADMMTFTEKLNDMGTTETEDDKTFTENDVDENTELAALVFDDTANLQSLENDNYKIDSITIKEKGKDTIIDNFYFEQDGNDINTYTLKWNSTKDVLTGKTEMDLYVNYTDGTKVSGIVRKEGLSITIDQTLDVQKLKWQNKATLPQTYTDVSGKINKNGINTSTLTKSYVKDGSFYIQVANIENESELTGATIEYSLKTNSTSNVISVATNGKVSIQGVSPEKADVKIQAKISKDGYVDTYVYLPVTISQGEVAFSYVDENGDTLPISNDKYSTKNITFGSNKNKFQLYTTGNPDGTEVSYKLKDETIKDVIEVDSKTGEITILNATTALQKDKVVVVATAHDPSGNYADVSIELPINIDKAKQEISLKETLINVVNGTGTISPEIITQDISSNQGEVKNTDYVISIDGTKYSGIAWSEDGKEIKYEYDGDEGTDIIYQVTRAGNRNYENAEPITGKLHILGKDEAMLEVSTVGKIIYGDHFKVKSLQDDDQSTNTKYTFEVDDPTYVSEPKINENEAEFDALKVTGKNMVTITVTRTADGEIPLSKKVTVNVLPKDIKIKIDNQTKLKGEENPSLTYQSFNSQLVSWNSTQDVIQSGDVKLNTTALVSSNAGSYPITGDGAYLNKTYPNYNFSFTNGTLKVTEENIEDDWYHMELDDGKDTSYKGTWTNQKVNIVSDHDEYVNVSKDQSAWTPNKVTIDKEGKTEQIFWLKKDSGAITSEKKETILIDQTAPTLTSVTAKDSRNQLQVLINTLSNGFFFRPNTTFEITTSDIKEKLEVSGTSSIDYKLYDSNKKLIKQDTLSVTKEKASITIEETTGTYQLCMILKDQAGNESGELCKTIDLKEIGQDSDGDGIPDINIDTDGDGKPDLNITKKQCENLQEDIECRIPYLNIDTKGNGQPDMNIDTDGDGIPDLNTGIVKEWKPDTLVDLDKDGKPDYKTDSTLKGLNNIDTDGDHYPDLNIDRDLDGIPELNINTDGKLDKPQTNIDGNGDGKPDINIDENGDGIPEKNVMDITEWKPEHNVTNDGKVVYDTMKLTFKEVDELEDNGIKVQPSDPNTSFLPNMALKVDDITSNTSDDTKKDIIKDSGETGKEVKKVYDVKLLEDNKVIQPDGSLKVSIPVDETVQNAKVMMKAKDGTWKVMEVKVENGYYVFETDYIGEVSVIGDPEVSDVKEPDPTPEPDPDTNVKEPSTTKPTVQGTYTAGTQTSNGIGNNMGGASTGDTTNILMYSILGFISLGMLVILFSKRKENNND